MNWPGSVANVRFAIASLDVAGREPSCSLDIWHRPKGENRKAHGLQPWEDDPRENRPERGGRVPGVIPKDNFVESDSMAFQKLTKLFPIRRPRAQSGGKGSVASNTITTISIRCSRCRFGRPFRAILFGSVPRPEGLGCSVFALRANKTSKLQSVAESKLLFGH